MSPSAPPPLEPSADRGLADGATNRHDAGGESAELAALRELLGHTHERWDDQRRQLARQLHDSLGSSMTALTMHLALLTQQLPQEKALLDRTAQMKSLLSTIINSNRDMQLALWNDSLEFLGVRPAMSEALDRFRERQQLLTRLSLPEDEIACTGRQATLLMMTLEEGLANIVAHAGASEVDVILDDDGDQLMLTVRDNGIGIGTDGSAADGADAQARHRGHGLRTLRERARHLGGSLWVGPSPLGDAGTRLILTLPRHAPRDGD